MADEQAGSGENTGNPDNTGGGEQGTSWMDQLSEDNRGFVQNKGFADPDTAIQSYRNLESHIGVPADRLVKLPSSDADPSEWSNVYAKLGRPEAPNGYEIPMPENGGDEKFANWFRETAHKLGMPKTVAEGLAQEWNNFAGTLGEEQQTVMQNKLAEQEAALQKEWGAKFDQNMQTARRAAHEFGVPGEAIDALEKQIGYDQVMKVFANIGAKLGEDSFETGDNGGNRGFNTMAPAEARAKIAELRADESWRKRYLAGDPAAKAQMDHLQKMASAK